MSLCEIPINSGKHFCNYDEYISVRVASVQVCNTVYLLIRPCSIGGDVLSCKGEYAVHGNAFHRQFGF